MAQITLKGNKINTSGNLPEKGTKVKDFTLVKNDLNEAHLKEYLGKKIILNIFPSLDTSVCSLSVKKFNALAKENPEIRILNISMDLPFAQGRFCGQEGISSVETLSAFRSSFGKDYGLEITDGPLKGLLSRAIIVLDEQGKVLYSEQVQEITQEPNYQKAAEALNLTRV